MTTASTWQIIGIITSSNILIKRELNGLVFNGTSTFLGYLMSKQSLQKNSIANTKPIARETKWFIPPPGVLVRMWT